MGFVIKRNGYGPKDWEWMLKCVSKKINSWAYQYLSLGGKMVLIVSVLQEIHVYWMTLFSIPASIFSRMREKLFHLLWSGSSETRKFHLVSWDKLSLPRDMGGWGFKHLSHFNAALRSKSLWRCLFGKGLWGNMIKEKYFKGLEPIIWMRDRTGVKSGVSTIWKSLVKSFHLSQTT